MKKMSLIAIAIASVTIAGFAYFSLQKKEKLKMYSFYTPSHKEMVDEWFRPSLTKDYDLVLECHEQKCPSGDSMEKGWIETMHYKVDVIIRGIKENWNKVFVHSDIDIQFFEPTADLILSLMKDNDMIIQRDAPDGRLCAGFFACRGNEKTLALWQNIKRLMDQYPQLNDQVFMNILLRQRNVFNVKWDYLPDTFYGGGTITGKHWDPGKELPVPEGIVIHHANCTVGIKNKEEQMKLVKGVVDQRKKQVAVV